jgi:hypothetical protein
VPQPRKQRITGKRIEFAKGYLISASYWKIPRKELPGGAASERVIGYALVTPAEAGVQANQWFLDPGFHRDDLSAFIGG